MKLINRLVAALLAGSFACSCLADTTPAASPPAAAGAPQACKQDIQSLCSGVTPGEGRIAACMRAHAKELSAGCREAIKAKRHAHGAERSSASEIPPP